MAPLRHPAAGGDADAAVEVVTVDDRDPLVDVGERPGGKQTRDTATEYDSAGMRAGTERT